MSAPRAVAQRLRGRRRDLAGLRVTGDWPAGPVGLSERAPACRLTRFAELRHLRSKAGTRSSIRSINCDSNPAVLASAGRSRLQANVAGHRGESPRASRVSPPGSGTAAAGRKLIRSRESPFPPFVVIWKSSVAVGAAVKVPFARMSKSPPSPPGVPNGSIPVGWPINSRLKFSALSPVSRSNPPNDPPL